MNNLNEIISGISIAAIVPTVVALLKLGIDSLNLRAVEKVLLSQSKRLIIYLSQVVITSFLTFLIAFVMYLLQVKFIVDKFEVIGLAIIIVICTLVISVLVFSVVNLFSVKFEFVFIDDHNVNWKLEKRISKDKVLASREADKFFRRFDLNSIIDKELERCMIKKIFLPGHKFINEKFAYVITILIILIVIDIYLISVNIDSIIPMVIGIILVPLGFLLLLYSICVKSNEDLMKQYPDT